MDKMLPNISKFKTAIKPFWAPVQEYFLLHLGAASPLALLPKRMRTEQTPIIFLLCSITRPSKH